ILVAKIEWLHRHAGSAGLDQQLAGMYLALDIELFHVQLRSALDYCAACISETSKKAGQVPNESFNSLQQWVAKNPTRAAALLDPEILRLLGNAHWFPDVRAVRDSLVHRGAWVLVFPDRERLLFQAYAGAWRTLVVQEHIMYNENVADFRLYAAILFSEFLLLLDGLTAVVSRKYPVQHGSGARSYCTGFPQVLEWLRQYALVTTGGLPVEPSGPPPAA
ncbi:MAG TPA: hypothetical protein VNG33_21545, partial [Polyangiaceae bacterium]|nr:hypothetical protein [Polyangiaceae bacterium]